MGDEGYKLSERALRRIIEAVRKIEGLPPKAPVGGRSWRQSPYHKTWYRIVSNTGNGAYTVRLQRWKPDASPPVLIDIDDPQHPEYGLNQNAWDCRGSDTGEVDDRVPGWRVWMNDVWYVVIEIPPAGGTATIPVKLSASNGGGSYTGKEQTWNGSVWVDKEGASNITVYNLFETTGSSGMSAVDITDGPVVVVTVVMVAGNPPVTWRFFAQLTKRETSSTTVRSAGSLERSDRAAAPPACQRATTWL